ncbi:hypothetical protein V1525DRAFT_432096 [Lipomyces kononenkoae]|uniref:Uncharacterized protein n=1 Tax=Lipomyces kononenkoae TaxID=34357 RepID=A0ACC3T2D6_LIPKO
MLESDVIDEVRDACETIVKAHGVCIATINTEYQRKFLRVMRGALGCIAGAPVALEIDDELEYAADEIIKS